MRRSVAAAAALAAAVAAVAVACGGPPPVARPAGPPTPVPAPLDDDARAWVDATLESLTLREKAAQLVIEWIPGAYASTSSPEFRQIERWVTEDRIGGLSISIGLPHSYVAKLNELQRRAEVPLLVTADFENGGPGMRIRGSYALPSLLPQGGGTDFPPTMAFGAIGEERFAHEYGRITATEARAVGVHLNFAPVLDVNSNPENPIINTRAFGEDPAEVARLGTAFIRGAREGGVMSTVKHFPGHGDTRTDSHVELPVVTADRARLDTLELVPFRAAIDAGVDAVMTAHVAVPEILGEDAPPATLSPYFLTDLLREEMAFGGILFTDAMSMGAIRRGYGVGEAAVRAVEAGADVILSPKRVTEAIDAVMAALASGRLTEARIDRSVRRLLEAKARAGLHRGRLTSIEAVDEIVGRREHTAFADTAAVRSLTLPRDRMSLVPLDPRVRTVFSLTFGRGANLIAGRTFDGRLAGGVDELETARADYRTRSEWYDSVSVAAARADAVVVSAYVPPRSGAGTVGVPDALRDFVAELVVAGRPVAVVSFGNPYLLTAFPTVPTYLLAWGGREVSQGAAARAFLGEVPVTGTLPISLPPFHERGEGLRREARPALADAPRHRETGIPRFEWEVEEGAGPGTPVDPVDPTSVGMDPEGLRRVDSIVRAAVADSAAPGAALAIGRHGELVRLRGFGRLDWAAGARAVTDSTIWDMASLTKVVGTTTAVMILAEEGRLSLDDRVVEHLPWWAGDDPRKGEVTVRHLLTHRAGLPPFRRFYLAIEGGEAYRDSIAGLDLEYAPGDSTVYSDIGMMTMAFVIEEVTGTGLDAFLEERVFGPLGMRDTGFRPEPELLPRIAPTEVDTVLERGHVRGVVHDENAYALGGVAGHAGLFSSARDLAVFARMMLGGGAVPPCPDDGIPCSAPRPDSVRILEPATIERFTRRHDETASRALGWDTPRPGSSSGDWLTAGAFGHTGFTGTSIWMDPELDLFVILLTNRVNPTRENRKHIPLRRAVADGAVKAITDREVAPREWAR